jgi:prepilin-type N-terminal cleavage/methylation domain-containing protein
LIIMKQLLGIVRLKNKSTTNKGFTLVETIMAVTLAGLTIAVLATSFINAVHLQKILEGRVTVIVLGESKLAELIGESEKSGSDVFPKPYANYKWLSQEETCEDGSTKITLTVDWGDGHGGPTNSRTFQGYRLPK